MGKAIFTFHGIYFFLTNPSLWRATICPLVFTGIFTLVVTILLFVLAFVPQAHLFEGYVSPFIAYIMALVVTLLEIILAICIFSSIVLQHYKTRLENRIYELKDVHLEDKSSCLNDFTVGMQFTVLSFIVFLVTLPLNALPIVGSAAFFALNGLLFGWSLHSSYFSLKKLTFSQQFTFIKKNWKDYMAFGASALLLLLVPLANFAIVYTNIVGAALWVVEMEKNSVLDGYFTPGTEMDVTKTAAPAPSSDIATSPETIITSQPTNTNGGYENIE
eukprot:TRINITY_DN3149_c0_g1_i2.p1 TRINITY_DN3149_c0_g1~~TRINITY_DN3149_c0_g1_i2.p1  ORF type:complete len:274 (+),score=66.02 TRINITY_DN3149_c0_g1_i2:479-1300(+)